MCYLVLFCATTTLYVVLYVHTQKNWTLLFFLIIQPNIVSDGFSVTFVIVVTVVVVVIVLVGAAKFLFLSGFPGTKKCILFLAIMGTLVY